jgi:hypothetical protein
MKVNGNRKHKMLVEFVSDVRYPPSLILEPGDAKKVTLVYE